MSKNNTATKLIFVRHGETNANAAGIWQGSTNSHLNERGRAQAQAVAQRLSDADDEIAAIYASPLGRAMETAEIIAEAIGDPPIIRDPDLAEFHLGAWEGLTYDELRFEKHLWDRLEADPNFAPPDGESAVMFATRLVDSVQRIARKHSGQTVIIVSHGGAIATVLSMLIERDGSRWPEYQMVNCALTELIFTPQPTLAQLNDKTHLHGVGALGEW